MPSPGEQAALAPEALLPSAAQQRDIEKFDGGFTLESAVAAPGKPHAAHAAVTDNRLERIGTQSHSGE